MSLTDRIPTGEQQLSNPVEVSEDAPQQPSKKIQNLKAANRETWEGLKSTIPMDAIVALRSKAAKLDVAARPQARH